MVTKEFKTRPELLDTVYRRFSNLDLVAERGFVKGVRLFNEMLEADELPGAGLALHLLIGTSLGSMRRYTKDVNVHLGPEGVDIVAYAEGKALTCLHLEMDTSDAIAAGLMPPEDVLVLMDGKLWTGGVFLIKKVRRADGSLTILYIIASASGVFGQKDEEIAAAVARRVASDWALGVEALDLPAQ